LRCSVAEIFVKTDGPTDIALSIAQERRGIGFYGQKLVNTQKRLEKENKMSWRYWD
jgi:hypothetical protein